MNYPVNSPEAAIDPAGRLIALDLGEKRIGVAVSDETRLLARSLTVLNRQSRLADFERIRKIVDEFDVSLIIVGLPVLNSGAEGEKAAWVRDYGRELQSAVGLDVVFWDESYTTVRAEASLRERGIRGRRRRRQVDAVAAAFILQSYLDEQREMRDHTSES